MWLALKIPSSPGGKKEILEQLLALSPQVAEGPDDCALVNLTGAARYWGLATLPAALRDNSQRGIPHPLVECWRQLSTRWKRRDPSWDGRGILAPTAPWAWAWLQAGFGESTAGLQWVDRERFVSAWADTPLLAQRLLLPDLLGSSETRAAFDDFIESLTDLGLERAADLTRAAPEQWVQRFGPFLRTLLARLQGRDDLVRMCFEPELRLEEKFYPRLERLIESERSQELLTRVQDVLERWEERLRARRSWLRGFQVRLVSERRQSVELITLTLPRPTREAATLLKIFQEKWLHRSEGTNSIFFDDTLDAVEVHSLGLQEENERQLNLFDPKREEQQEAWNTLLGRLMARSTTKDPVEVGAYAPRDSWFPESASEWAPWADTASCLLPIPQHPRRPVFLLKETQALREVRSERDFLDWARREDPALLSLERLNDPWKAAIGQNSTRHYARVRLPHNDVQAWAYWDPAQQRAYVHGYFD